MPHRGRMPFAETGAGGCPDCSRGGLLVFLYFPFPSLLKHNPRLPSPFSPFCLRGCTDARPEYTDVRLECADALGVWRSADMKLLKIIRIFCNFVPASR